MTIINTIEHDGCRITIHPDSDASDPSVEFDNYSPEEVAAWREGDVFDFEVYTLAPETGDVGFIESCWGFYGWESWDYMVGVAKDAAADHAAQLAAEALEVLDLIHY